MTVKAAFQKGHERMTERPSLGGRQAYLLDNNRLHVRAQFQHLAC